MTYRQLYASRFSRDAAADVHSAHCPDSFMGLTANFSCPQRQDTSITCSQCWDRETEDTHDRNDDADPDC